jgi:hypothetical protein
MPAAGVVAASSSPAQVEARERETDAGKTCMENDRKREIEIVSKALAKLKLIGEEKKAWDIIQGLVKG